MSITKTFLLFTAVVLLPALLMAQPLSPSEVQLVEYIDAHQEEAIDFLKQVVNINSGTMNHEGVRQVGEVFRKELDALEFASRWIPMDEVNRAGHLFAEVSGQRGRRLLLIGHLDTVFAVDSPFQRFERSGSQAKGPGVEDMKGGNVVVLFALKALHSVGALEGASITVAFTGDEENSGDPQQISRRDLMEAAKRSDIALGFEGGIGGIGTATVARRSATDWALHVNGKRGHSSRIFNPEFGSGAIYEAARILTDFYNELGGEPYLSFSPGLILGGTTVDHEGIYSRGQAFGKDNVIPQTAVVTGDLRCISEEQLGRAKNRMQEIVSRHLPETSAEITFDDGYPAMSPTPENYSLLAQLDQVSRDLGFGAVEAIDPSKRGAADISFAAPHVQASLDGLGVVGSGGHSEEETVDLDSLSIMTKRAAVLIYRLTR
ncbi:MAG: M20/M25/M40 family metallo-hydrolase [Acidobacteriota bacterium]